MEFIKRCLTCDKVFSKRYTESVKTWNTIRKFCSYECKHRSPRSEEYREKLSLAKKRNPPKNLFMNHEAHPRWTGDDVSYGGVHKWVHREYGKARDYPCELASSECKGRHAWSNKTEKYLRRRTDWWVLCQRHHMRYDNVPQKISDAALLKRKLKWNVA